LGSISVRSNEIGVTIVVIVSSIDGISEYKTTDGRFLIGLECPVSVPLVDQSACAASGNYVRDPVAVDIGEMRIRRDVGKIRHSRLEGAVAFS
jgi:hypothetical protein